MKKYIYIIILLVSSSLLSANNTDTTKKFSYPIGNWTMQVISGKNLFPTYIADPLVVKFEVSSQNTKYSEFDYADPINKEGEYLNRLTITPGVRFSLFRFSPKSNPNLGVEADLGFATPLAMRGGNHDLIGTDGIYYFAIAGKPTEWLALRFSKHHICTHLGDEFTGDGIDSPTDYDPNVTQLPVRDDMILSAAIKPLYFLNKDLKDLVQIYGDFGFFWPGVDFLGNRQNKSNRDAYFNFQAGIETEYYFKNDYFGGVYAAFNWSTYQNNGFSPNLNTAVGYYLPQTMNSKRLRVGFNYYNGRSLINQFYNYREKFLAFHVAMDM